MFPINLDLTRVPVLLAGTSELVGKRLALLDEAKAQHVKVYCDQPSAELKQLAGTRLMVRQPTGQDIKDHAVILLAGYDRITSEALTGWAHAHGKLVNAEDITDLCDFYFTSTIRRGDLVISVSTSGTSPTLAKRIRDTIAGIFGPEWGERVRQVADLRNGLKANGAGMKDIMDKTDHYLADKGWFDHGDKAA